MYPFNEILLFKCVYMYVSTFICLCDGVEHIYVGICIWVPRKITLIDFILVNASIPDSQECQIYNVLESQFMFWSLCTTCTIGPLAFITLMDSQLISNAKNLTICVLIFMHYLYNWSIGIYSFDGFTIDK